MRENQALCYYQSSFAAAIYFCEALVKTPGSELLRICEIYSTACSGSWPSLFVNSSISSPAMASVQFVIKTAAIEKAEQAAESKNDEAPLTFRQKLLRLFGLY